MFDTATMSVPPLYTLSFSLPASAEAVDENLGQGFSRTEWEQSHEASQQRGESFLLIWVNSE